VRALEDKITWLFVFFSKTFAFIAFLMIFNSTISTLFQENFIVESFDVPSSFQSDGVTGQFVAGQFTDEISRIQKEGWSISGLNISDLFNKKVEKDIVFFGVSLNAIKALLRDIFKVEDKTVTGNLLTRKTQLYLKLSIAGQNIIITKNINDFDNVYMAYDALNLEAAQQFLMTVDPFILASYFWSIKEDEQSISIIQHIINNRTKDVDSAYLLWGQLLAKKNNYEKSIVKFSNALDNNKASFLAWNAWGTVLLAQGENKAAIPKFKSATSIEPSFSRSWHQWGVALAREGKHEEAIVKFLNAIDCDDTWAVTYNEISYEYSAIGDIDKAILYLNKGINQFPNESILYATLAEHYWTLNNQAKSHYYIKEAINKGFDITPYTNDEPYNSFSKKDK
jgi:tetratricopeptide (TPR) repeat protein